MNERLPWIETINDPPHRVTITGRFGAGFRGYMWGEPTRIAGEMASIYKEPALRGIHGGLVRLTIASAHPSSWILHENGKAERIAELKLM